MKETKIALGLILNPKKFDVLWKASCRVKGLRAKNNEPASKWEQYLFLSFLFCCFAMLLYMVFSTSAGDKSIEVFSFCALMIIILITSQLKSFIYVTHLLGVTQLKHEESAN